MPLALNRLICTRRHSGLKACGQGIQGEAACCECKMHTQRCKIRDFNPGDFDPTSFVVFVPPSRGLRPCRQTITPSSLYSSHHLVANVLVGIP